jgi:glycosyltransferase involved in cell wall biosynthesis
MKRSLYRGFHGAVVGGAAHRDYASSLGIPAHRCIPGYDVIDNEHFSTGARLARLKAAELSGSLGLPPLFFVTANRFVEKKNLRRLLQAYADYRDRIGAEAYPLVMLGDGPDRAALEELSSRLGLSSFVLFKGLANYDELPVYFGLAQAFIHASTVEQWGLVVNEAMASGLPVLVSRTCGCCGTLLEEGTNGYSFDPFSSEDIAATLVRFHALDDLQRRGMSARSQAIISEWGPPRFAQAVWQALHADGIPE